MKIPRLFYGTRADVKKRMSPIIKALRAGSSVDAIDFGESMDTREDGNAVLLLNPGRWVSTRENGFHCYAFLYALMEAEAKGRLPRDRQCFYQAFVWSLGPTWAFVGTLGEAGGIFFLRMPREAFTREPPPEVLRGKPEWYGPYLKAALAHWRELEEEGPRFAPAAAVHGDVFARVVSTVKNVLGQCGVVSKASEIDTPAKVLAAVHRALEKLDN